MKRDYVLDYLIGAVNKNLISLSLSKKELENFIQTTFNNYNPRKASQKAQRTVPSLEVKTQLHKFFETEDCTLDDESLTFYTI